MTCGSGVRVKTRTCVYPEPTCPGDECPGSATEEMTCKEQDCCPVGGCQPGKPNNCVNISLVENVSDLMLFLIYIHLTGFIKFIIMALVSYWINPLQYHR